MTPELLVKLAKAREAAALKKRQMSAQNAVSVAEAITMAKEERKQALIDKARKKVAHLPLDSLCHHLVDPHSGRVADPHSGRVADPHSGRVADDAAPNATNAPNDDPKPKGGGASRLDRVADEVKYLAKYHALKTLVKYGNHGNHGGKSHQHQPVVQQPQQPLQQTQPMAVAKEALRSRVSDEAMRLAYISLFPSG